MELLLVTAAGFLAALASPFVVRLGRIGPWMLALVPAALTAFFLSHLDTVADGEVVTTSFAWVSALGIDFALRLDGLSLLFGLLIAGIGTVVVIYAGSYMEGHPRLGRFYFLLFFFMGSMLGVVLADNLMVLFVSWELTSISSFGLISFESEDDSARAAASQALFVTASTGLAMLAGFVLLGIAGGTQEISALVAAGRVIEDDSLYLPILVLVLIGAFAKSAQFPFYFWLPNAMAAPTPVSAYLHSATMVKAGVYLLARLSPVLGGEVWTAALMLFGGITMVLGALFALRETDLKRMLAYSTVGTLGLLVLVIGADTHAAMLAAMVFILAHAIYKATLFLNAGIIDHETGTRDVERLGGLRRLMPVTAGTTILAAASMSGIVFLFGFIAKESVYEAVQELPRYALFATIGVMLSGVLQVALALRLVVKPIFGPPQGNSNVHDGGIPLLAGPVFLSALGLLLGFFPGIVDGELLGPAATAATGDEEPASLYLWHGLTLTLFLSILTLALGVIAYLRLPALRSKLAAGAVLSTRVRPEAIYAWLMNGLPGAAEKQTRFLQHGYLRLYLTAVVIAATILGAGTMLLRGGFDLPDSSSGVLLYEVVISIVIFAAALMAVLARTRIVAAVALGGVGYGIALLYLLFGAPDLAMTQILVETLVVLLFVFAFYRLPRFANYTTAAQRIRDMGISIAAGLFVMALMFTMLSVEHNPSVSNSMAEMSKPLGHGSNIVNVILVDFRALDTMGEISVLLAATLGVLALLKLRSKQEDRE